MEPAKIPEPPVDRDWHPADVTAEPKKRGHSLADLAIVHGYDPSAVGKALKKSWPAMEQIIARELGTWVAVWLVGGHKRYG